MLFSELTQPFRTVSFRKETISNKLNMKTAILITSWGKQVMFTPETENEIEALKMITPDDNIHTVIKRGTYSDRPEVFGANVFECVGGYYRAGEQPDSVMFVLTPKEKKVCKTSDTHIGCSNDCFASHGQRIM